MTQKKVFVFTNKQNNQHHSFSRVFSGGSYGHLFKKWKGQKPLLGLFLGWILMFVLWALDLCVTQTNVSINFFFWWKNKLWINEKLNTRARNIVRAKNRVGFKLRGGPQKNFELKRRGVPQETPWGLASKAWLKIERRVSLSFHMRLTPRFSLFSLGRHGSIAQF